MQDVTFHLPDVLDDETQRAVLVLQKAQAQLIHDQTTADLQARQAQALQAVEAASAAIAELDQAAKP